MASRIKFPPTIPFSLLFMMSLKLENLWNFNKMHSWFSQFITKARKATYSTFISQCGFSYGVPHKYSLQEVARRVDSKNVIPHSGPYSYYHLVKGLRAGWFCLAGWTRPVGRRLPTPVLHAIAELNSFSMHCC